MKKASIALLLIIILTLSACLFVACGKNDSAPTPSEEVTPGGGDTPSTPTKLATPVVSVDNTGLVSWADIANASGYKVDVNGSVSDFVRQISLLDGETVKVKAVGDGTNYSDSDWSRAVTYHAPAAQPTKLATPVVSIDNTGLVSWNQIANASGYKVDINGNVSDYTRPITLLDGEIVKIKAVGDGTRYLDGDWSTPVAYHVPAPEELVLSFVNNTGLATWNAISSATEYRIIVYSAVNDSLVTTVTVEPSVRTYQMDLNTYIRVVSGSHISDTLYYVQKTGKLSLPTYTFKYSDGDWGIKLLYIEDYESQGVSSQVKGIEFKVNDQVCNVDDYIWGTETFHKGDVVALRTTAYSYSSYADSDWNIITFDVCDHHENIYYYPLVFPTEEMRGHLSFFKCVDCGCIMTDPGDGIDGAFRHMEYLDDDIAYPQSFNILEHSEQHEWLYDESGHWEITYCLNCCEYEISNEKHAHTMENGVCSICGYSANMAMPDDISLTAEGYTFPRVLPYLTISATYDHELTQNELAYVADSFIVLPLVHNNLYADRFRPLGQINHYQESDWYEQHGNTVEISFANECSYDYEIDYGIVQAVVILRNGDVYISNEYSESVISALSIVEGQEIAVGVTAPIQYEISCLDWYWVANHVIEWSSSDESVLSIDEYGNMTAHKAGTVSINASVPAGYSYAVPGLGVYYAAGRGWNGIRTFGEITVKEEVLPTEIKTRETVAMTTKHPYQIEVELLPIGSRTTFTYVSNNNAVATVDATGLVTAHSAGNADITVTSSNGLTKVVHITVEEYALLNRTALDYDYTDFYNNSVFGNNTPLEGDLHLLVLPVKFEESEPLYDYDLIRHDIEIAFFGTKEFNGYDTVKSYYEKESRGELTINGVVGDWFTTRSVRKLVDTKSGYDLLEYTVQDLAKWAVENYIEQNTVDGVVPSLKEYDNDGDGYLDGVVIIYAYPNRNNRADIIQNGEYLSEAYSNDLLWAEALHFSSADAGNADAPVLSKTFMFASFDFMYPNSRSAVSQDGALLTDSTRIGEYKAFYVSGYESANNYMSHNGYGNGFHKYVATSTYIHEMAHMFGINDYYDLGTGSFVLKNLDGGFNMQNYGVGAHDPYSRMAMGWIDPYIITEGCTVELNPIESTGDVILLPIAGHTVTSPFDEYLLIELYTPTRLNEFDSMYQTSVESGIGPNIAGCRVWHADSRIVDNSGDLIEGGVIDGSTLVKHATSNTFGDGADGYKEYYQLMLLRKNAGVDDDAFYVQHAIDNSVLPSSPDNIYESPLAAENLFVTGDTFDMTRYAKAFYNEGLMDSGEELGWTITFEYVDGERAIITFTKTI